MEEAWHRSQSSSQSRICGFDEYKKTQVPHFRAAGPGHGDDQEAVR